MLMERNVSQSFTAEPCAANGFSIGDSVLSLDCELPMQSLLSEETEIPEEPSLPNRRIGFVPARCSAPSINNCQAAERRTAKTPRAASLID